jgi:hypothetical protein
LKETRITRVWGDRYGAEWVKEQFRKHGVNYEPSEKTKSDIYAELLAPVNSGAVALLDHPKLFAAAAHPSTTNVAATTIPPTLSPVR